MLAEKKSLLLTVSIVILLVTNWLTWNNTRELQQQMNNLQGELHNVHSQVSNEVAGIRGVVQGMKNDARWWTPAEVEFLDSDGEKATLKLSWNLKEYNDKSKVMLNYLPPGKAQYTQVVVEEESKGRFSVHLPVKIPLEPVVDMHLEKVRSKINEKSRTVVSEARTADSTNFSFMYYISVQDGDMIRTSDKSSLDLTKLKFKLFNPLNLRVKLSENNETINARMHEHKVSDPAYKIQHIYLQTRKGQEQVLEVWPFAIAETPAEERKEFMSYNVEVSPAKDYDSLYVVIKYSGGLSVEKEITRI